MIRSDGRPRRKLRPPRRRRRLVFSSLSSLFACFVVLTCALFVWPPAARPHRVDGVLSLNGTSENLREQRALALVRDGYAHVLLFSEGHYPNVPCPKVPRSHVVCFIPKPARTVGEVEFAEQYAAKHGWGSIIIVSGHAQATRARLLARRCFKGRALVVPAAAPSSLWSRLYGVVYEWGALAKALLLARGC